MSRDAVPVLPDWLIEGAMQLHSSQRGVALGYAASGWIAGYQDGFGNGFDAAMAAVHEFDEARKVHATEEAGADDE